MSNPVNVALIKTKYPVTADLDDFAVQLYIDEAYNSHKESSFKSSTAFNYAVELYTMKSLIAANPKLAQEYDKTGEKIRSEEGNSKEEYEVRYGGSARQASFDIFSDLYEKHLKRSIITTRVYPSVRY